MKDALSAEGCSERTGNDAPAVSRMKERSPASADSRPNKCCKTGFAATRPQKDAAFLAQGRMHAILF